MRINNLEHPRPMGIYTKNNYANRILERDWYYTTYHGCPERMLIRRTESTYYEDSRFDFFTSTRWSNSYMPIRNWMESGELYEIILNEDGTILLLDIVCDLPFKERLEKMKKLKLDDKTILAEYKPISGSLAIQNATRKAVKEGAEGIVLTAADKMYRQGETSSLLRIFSGIQDRMECKVVDAVDDSHIIIDTGKEFVTMQYNNANDVIGKKLEIYSYDGEFYGHKVCDE